MLALRTRYKTPFRRLSARLSLSLHLSGPLLLCLPTILTWRPRLTPSRTRRRSSSVRRRILRSVVLEHHPTPVYCIFTCRQIAGMTAKIFEHPFDLTKVRLQSQVLDATARFSGPLDCLVQTWKKEGIRGLYRVRATSRSSAVLMLIPSPPNFWSRITCAGPPRPDRRRDG